MEETGEVFYVVTPQCRSGSDRTGNKYALSTKPEVKMAGYWPSSLFCVFMDRDEVGIRAGKMGQSEHRIRFILPTGTANDIVVSLLTLTRQ